MRLSKLIEWIRSRFSPANGGKISDGVVSGEMTQGIELWSRMYHGNPEWIKKGTTSLGLAAAVAEEYARLVTLEMVSELSGSPRADFLDSVYQQLLTRLKNAQLEYACAKGGMVFKPYVQGGGLYIDCVQADRFYPTAFDSGGRLTGAVFAEQLVRDGVIYTRLESHSFADGVENIINKAFSSRSSTALGAEIPLSDVPEWADIEPETRVENLTAPLFSYFSPCAANNLDDTSPLGVSVYARATELIRDADMQYGRLLWEFEGGELAVDAAPDMLRPTDGKCLVMPSGRERLFRQLESADTDFYNVFSPQLRDTSIINGLNAILRRIEYNCRLSYGTLSDPQDVDKTAEEIKASKQRSYSAIAKTQESLSAALRGLVTAMDALCTLYGLSPAGNIEQSFSFDDSIVADRKTEFQERMQLQTASGMRPEVNLAWYFGISEDDAKQLLTDPDGTASFWGEA